MEGTVLYLHIERPGGFAGHVELEGQMLPNAADIDIGQHSLDLFEHLVICHKILLSKNSRCLWDSGRNYSAEMRK